MIVEYCLAFTLKDLFYTLFLFVFVYSVTGVFFFLHQVSWTETQQTGSVCSLLLILHLDLKTE